MFFGLIGRTLKILLEKPNVSTVTANYIIKGGAVMSS